MCNNLTFSLHSLVGTIEVSGKKVGKRFTIMAFLRLKISSHRRIRLIEKILETKNFLL
jgi:hypothetical protein